MSIRLKFKNSTQTTYQVNPSKKTAARCSQHYKRKVYSQGSGHAKISSQNGRIQHLWQWNRLVAEESSLEEPAGQEQKGIIFQAV